MKTEQALKVRADISRKLAEARAALSENAATRKRLAFASATGSTEAQAETRRLQKASAALHDEADALEAALAEAQRRVDAAQAADADAKERANAEAALDLLDKFRRRGEMLDTAINAALGEYRDLVDDVRQLERLGYGPTSVALVASNMRTALATKLMTTDLRQEFIAPGQRRNFSDVVTAWAFNAESRARSRLAKNANTAAKAA